MVDDCPGERGSRGSGEYGGRPRLDPRDGDALERHYPEDPMTETPTRPATRFEPLFDRLLVRPIAEEERTASGLLVIPDANKPRPRRGLVLATGPGRVNERTGGLVPLAVRAGDRVVYGKYSGGELALNGEDLLIMREDEVLGLERPDRGDR